MLKWIHSLLGKLFMLAGALVLSQMPLFMQYYTQQLAGRVAELQWQVEGINQMASLSNKTVQQYVHKFLSSDDTDFQQQGDFMNDILLRSRDFNASLAALQQAKVWVKPWIFLQNLNWTIVKATYRSYEPGLTLNIEGFIFALIGAVIGSGIFHLISYCCYSLIKLFKPRNSVKAN